MKRIALASLLALSHALAASGRVAAQESQPGPAPADAGGASDASDHSGAATDADAAPEQAAPLPSSASAHIGVAPLMVRGHKMETRDQIYPGERKLATIDVTSPDYRPDLAALGARSKPAEIDPEKLRERTLALYGGTAPEPGPTVATANAPKGRRAPRPDPSTEDPAALVMPIGVGISLLTIVAGVVITRLRRRAPAAAPDARTPRAPRK